MNASIARSGCAMTLCAALVLALWGGASVWHAAPAWAQNSGDHTYTRLGQYTGRQSREMMEELATQDAVRNALAAMIKDAIGATSLRDNTRLIESRMLNQVERYVVETEIVGRSYLSSTYKVRASVSFDPVPVQKDLLALGILQPWEHAGVTYVHWFVRDAAADPARMRGGWKPLVNASVQDQAELFLRSNGISIRRYDASGLKIPEGGWNNPLTPVRAITDPVVVDSPHLVMALTQITDQTDAFFASAITQVAYAIDDGRGKLFAGRDYPRGDFVLSALSTTSVALGLSSRGIDQALAPIVNHLNELQQSRTQRYQWRLGLFSRVGRAPLVVAANTLAAVPGINAVTPESIVPREGVHEMQLYFFSSSTTDTIMDHLARALPDAQISMEAARAFRVDLLGDIGVQ